MSFLLLPEREETCYHLSGCFVASNTRPLCVCCRGDVVLIFEEIKKGEKSDVNKRRLLVSGNVQPSAFAQQQSHTTLCVLSQLHTHTHKQTAPLKARRRLIGFLVFNCQSIRRGPIYMCANWAAIGLAIRAAAAAAGEADSSRAIEQPAGRRRHCNNNLRPL